MRFVLVVVAVAVAASALSAPLGFRSGSFAAREEPRPDREGPTGPGDPPPSDGKEGRLVAVLTTSGKLSSP